jgi:hypothetical protein
MGIPWWDELEDGLNFLYHDPIQDDIRRKTVRPEMPHRGGFGSEFSFEISYYICTTFAVCVFPVGLAAPLGL